MNQEKYKLLSIIQARLSSQRLPSKVLMKLGNSNVIGQVIKRAKIFSDKVIVCTSKDKTDDEIAEYCLKNNVLCFRGNLNNVFSRFKKILENKRYSEFDWFARLTADNPLVSEQLAWHLRRNIEKNIDYLAYEKNEINIGSGIEIVNKKTFLSINESLLDNSEKEHVTLKLYEKVGNYKCKFIKSPFKNFYPDVRLTLDYKEDYELLKRIFKYNPEINTEDAISFLSENKQFLNMNKNCIQKRVRQ